MTLENIDQPKETMDDLKEYLSKECGILLIRGGTGTGKTLICENIPQPNHHVCYLELKSRFNSCNNDQVENFLNNISSLGVLIIDGIEPTGKNFFEFMRRLVKRRFANRESLYTVFTITEKDYFLFDNDSDFIDIITSGDIIELKGESRRKQSYQQA